MAEFVYTCSALICAACTFLLFKNYRRTKAEILLWLAWSFVCLTLNNCFICVDLLILPDLDMAGSLVRNTLFALSGLILVTGLVWEMS